MVLAQSKESNVVIRIIALKIAEEQTRQDEVTIADTVQLGRCFDMEFASSIGFVAELRVNCNNILRIHLQLIKLEALLDAVELTYDSINYCFQIF